MILESRNIGAARPTPIVTMCKTLKSRKKAL